MKKIVFGILLIVISNTTFSQWNFLGLENKTIKNIKIFNDTIYAGTNDGVYKKPLISSDTLWIPIGLQNKKIVSILILDNNELFAIISLESPNDSALCYKTVNGGIFWSVSYYSQSIGSGNFSQYLNYIDAIPSYGDTIYIIDIIKGGIFKSINKGNSWTNVYNYPIIYRFIKINPYSPNQIWFGGEGGFFNALLFQSTNFGNNWNNINFSNVFQGDNCAHNIVFHQDDMNTWYIPGEGKIAKTTNCGTDWQIIFDQWSTPVGHYLYDMAISPINSNVLYVIGFSSQPPGNVKYYIFKSANAGISWDTLTFQPGITGVYGFYTMDIINQNGIDIIILGGNKGVYKFENSGSYIRDLYNKNSFILKQNYPNPFSYHTKISFLSTKSSIGEFEIHDLVGKNIYSEFRKFGKGNNNIYLNLSHLKSGIYYYSIKIDGLLLSRKMIKIN